MRNNTFLTLLFGACLALSACGGSSGGYRPATAAGAPMDDATISARVKTVLLNDTQVSATKIDVTTSAGVVTLAGSVRTAGEEARALELARTVTGVRAVKSALQVMPESR